MIRKAVVEVTLRVVVEEKEVPLHAAIDNFLERALHSNTDIKTQGLVDANCTNVCTIHEWEEEEIIS